MPALQALIFDVDGTLAETEELHRAAFNEVFAAPGGPGWHWDTALYAELLLVTGGKERMRAYASRIGATVDDAAIAALHAAKTAAYTRRVAQGGLVLRPGVRRLLAAAKSAGLKLAIATTTSLPNVEALLAAVAPIPAFDVIAAGDEVAAKKPAPDVYELALSRLALPPEACVALEDTENGVRSAVGAGLRCVVTVSLYGGTGPFADAAAVVEHLGEPEAPARTLQGPPAPGGVAGLDWLDRLS